MMETPATTPPMPTAGAPAPAAVCTQAEFAAHMQWRKSYVTKLKQEQRLVLTDDGLVDVAASLARIKATTGAGTRADPGVMGPQYADAKDRNEHYTAELNRIRFEREIGALRDAAEVADITADVAATLAAWLDALPDRLAPMLAAIGGDEARIRAALRDHMNAERAEVARGFAALARVHPPTAG